MRHVSTSLQAALAAIMLAVILAPGPAFAQGEAADKTLGAAILSANVALDGTLQHGAGAVSAQKAPALGPNAYVVQFSRNVDNSRCTLSAAVIDFHADKHFVATALPSGVTVAVRTFEGGTGEPAAAPFHLIVVCNR